MFPATLYSYLSFMFFQAVSSERVLPIHELSDEQLMSDVLVGNTAAFRQLYERYAAVVTGLSYKIVGERHLAEEVAQETFWRVWQHAGTFDAQRGKFAHWMFGITRNLAIDALRQHQKLPVFEPNSGEGLPEETVFFQAEHDVAEIAWSSLKTKQVHQALADLPSEQREVVEWIFFHGKSRREIAEEKKIPFGTINTRAKLALDKLRRSLQAFGFED